MCAHEWITFPGESHQALSAPKLNAPNTSSDKIQVPLPYTRGVSEKLSYVFNKHGVKVYHKPFNSFRSILVHPKDPTPQENNCSVIYEIVCSNCDLSYVGETTRSYSTRFKEHSNTTQKTLSAVGEHRQSTGHTINFEDCSILATESERLRRKKIKEAIYIYQNAPSLLKPEQQLRAATNLILTFFSHKSTRRDITWQRLCDRIGSLWLSKLWYRTDIFLLLLNILF